MIRHAIILFLLTFLVIQANAQQRVLLYGNVTDSDGIALVQVHVSIKNTGLGTFTNAKGYYEFTVPLKQHAYVVFSSVGFEPKTVPMPTITDPQVKEARISVHLAPAVTQIVEVNVVESFTGGANLHRIDPKQIVFLPGSAIGGIETLLKTMPGVTSTNELSSQYSVRGGNFDENLVYVNDIQVYRPQLVRSGKQEGLSFVNINMVEGVAFSAGGFEAKYGDKLSSVLHVNYKTPQKNAGSVSIAASGAEAHFEGISKNQKLTTLVGYRYKTTKFLLSSLDTKGDYNPIFSDFQALVNYKVNRKLTVGYFGNFVQNAFLFVPETSQTVFGAMTGAGSVGFEFSAYYEGQENDRFGAYTNALTVDYNLNEQVKLKFSVSDYYGNEKERFDIYGAYYLNDIDKNLGSETVGDSTLNIGVGEFLHHARNTLKQNIVTVSHKGIFDNENRVLLWGVDYKMEQVLDRINEWKVIDSIGFSIPYVGDQIQLHEHINSENRMQNHKVSAYLQESYTTHTYKGKLSLTAGLRGFFNSYTNEWVASPRVAGHFEPFSQPNTVYRISGGFYYQPPFYKETRLFDGTLYENPKSQKSVQLVAGFETNFKGWDRKFKMVTELYYKHFLHVVPYELNNVRVHYYADQSATGYATGIDCKVFGQFVEGVDSWFSFSLLRSMEKIEGLTDGYIRRPSDRLLNFGVFFQDYFPGNNTYRFSLTGTYAGGVPYGPPKVGRQLATGSMPPYKRIDVGFSKDIADILPKSKKQNRALITAELYNVFGFDNVISYSWLQVVPNSTLVQSGETYQYPVPNRLTNRRINIKLTLFL